MTLTWVVRSLLTIDNGVFEVAATNSDTHLGVEEFDQRVSDLPDKENNLAVNQVDALLSSVLSLSCFMRLRFLRCTILMFITRCGRVAFDIVACLQVVFVWYLSRRQ